MELLDDSYLAAGRTKLARGFCEDAARQPSSLRLEQWASIMLGIFWERECRFAMRHRGDDAMLAAGAPILATMAEVGAADAKLALFAIGRVARGSLARRARQLADGLSGPIPPRAADVGTGQFVSAFCASSPGDGEAIVLDTDCTGERSHMLAVYIDARLGGIAKHVQPLRRFDPLDPDDPLSDPALPFAPADLTATSRKVRTAIRRTDTAKAPPVDNSFSHYRGLALARLSPLREGA